MNTFEIEETILRDRRLHKYFLGVYPSDKVLRITKRPYCLIANTDPTSKPGKSWVALFFDKDDEYFDSYGLEQFEALEIYEPEIISKYCLHNFDSVVCGKYCLYLLHQRSRGPYK